MEIAEVVMNPVRQRIFQYFLLHETGTVKDIKKALPDVPSASLYRHVKILADSSILMIVGENRIRGTVESIYRMNKSALSAGDESGEAVQMSLMSICAAFAKYFSGRQCRSRKGYAAVHQLHAAADGRGVFRFPFRDQRSCPQVHECRGESRQQNAADHAHLSTNE